MYFYDVLFNQTTQMVYFEGGYRTTKVYQLKSLSPNQTINGPAIIIDNLSTILVEPNCEAIITLQGDIQICIGDAIRTPVSSQLDPIQLSIFSHRFMSIAEQMGRL